jgi:diamine N-acetyltransferase
MKVRPTSDPAAVKPAIVVRKTLASDLEAVLEIERHPDNSPFIGAWTREQHSAVISAGGEHWVIVADGEDAPGGYLIAFDLTSEGFGVWVQRMAIASKSRGVGRAVLRTYLADAMRRFHADSATLDVMPTNMRAQRMYRALGFIDGELDAPERKRLHDLVGGFDDDGIILRLAGEPLRSDHRHDVHIR